MKLNSAVVKVVLIVVQVVFLAGCKRALWPARPQGTGWADGVFQTNGERIYFTSTSDRGTRITYAGGPGSGNWMMMQGRLSCVSCHGTDGRGGQHSMGMSQVMDAADIRWPELEEEFGADEERIGLAITEGQDHDGTQLERDMPRWTMDDEDLTDLIAFLKTLL